jgi:two-component SAPR family response regulator
VATGVKRDDMLRKITGIRTMIAMNPNYTSLERDRLHMIDTLAAAYAETGDFNSAIQYTAQALAVKGISADSTKLFQQHLELF